MPRHAAIDRAIAFLAGQQLASGQFPIEVTRLEQLESGSGSPAVRPEKSPFCTAFIVSALASCDDPRTQSMIVRGLDFLEREKSRGSLWRYWCKDAPLHGQVPPDVDDTACISDLLRRLGRGSTDNEDLLLANRSSNGLFHTWIVPRLANTSSARWWWVVLTDVTYGRLVTFWRAGAQRGDIDSVVNANVVHYLGNRAESVPVVRWLVEVSSTGLEESSDKWYRNRFAFYYAVSRCYAAGIEGLEPAIENMKRSFCVAIAPDGRIGSNELDTALAVCAMANAEGTPDSLGKSVQYLMDTQDADGGWESRPFYFDGRLEPKMAWGSRAITTGFCLEALARS